MIKGELMRYIVAGALAFLCDIVVLYVLTEYFSVHYLLSNIWGYFAGLIVSYYLNVHWVFSYRRFQQRSTLEFVIFNCIVLAGLGLSELLMFIIVGMGEMHYLTAKIAASVIVTLFNYFAKKTILFQPSTDPGGA
jgi:putative flippase GtrA